MSIAWAWVVFELSLGQNDVGLGRHAGLIPVFCKFKRLLVSDDRVIEYLLLCICCAQLEIILRKSLIDSRKACRSAALACALAVADSTWRLTRPHTSISQRVSSDSEY